MLPQPCHPRVPLANPSILSCQPPRKNLFQNRFWNKFSIISQINHHTRASGSGTPRLRTADPCVDRARTEVVLLETISPTPLIVSDLYKSVYGQPVEALWKLCGRSVEAWRFFIENVLRVVGYNIINGVVRDKCRELRERSTENVTPMHAHGGEQLTAYLFSIKTGSSGLRCDSFNLEPTATAKRELRRRWLQVKRIARDCRTSTRKSP